MDAEIRPSTETAGEPVTIVGVGGV